ncbi:hypothetical protein AB5J52_48535 (plasmid) [Streptomyces sp. R39]|uniref:Uncharacterized protein n=1 Tax=Streptomyces sp. R39 TaxID=3238631 RepID=A0AB39R532_9ACTN
MSRASVACELAEHGTERHAGLLRPLARPEGGAVWATWTTPAEIVCLALNDCGKRGQSQESSCGLFLEHPGSCSYEQEDALKEDTTRAARIDAALAVLGGADQHDARIVQTAAHDAALLTWDELRASRIWPQLPACDHAAVYRLLAHADSVHATRASIASAARDLAGDVLQITHLWAPDAPQQLPHGDAAADLLSALARIPAGWQSWALGSQRKSRHLSRIPLNEAVEVATRHGSEGPAPRSESGWEAQRDRKEVERLGPIIRERLRGLPHGWQVDTVRRIALGADALGAVAGAARSMNVIRRYGLYLAWNTAGPSVQTGRSSAPSSRRRTPGAS